MSVDRRWRNALLPGNASVQEAIQNLDDHALQIVLIVGESGKLEGTLSDGDLRRGLLRGMDMKSSISEIVNQNPFVVPRDISPDMVRRIMTANNIRQIPIVDDANRVVGLHLWDLISTPETKPNTMVVMAGGKGTRLRPYTEDCPKPMLHVAGKPMLEHIILKAMDEGFKSFVISVGYLGHMIESYFSDGRNLGIDIEYLEESEPLGTAGALSLLNPRDELPFVVTNGDVITNIQYGKILDFHSQNQACGTMAVHSYEWQNPYGVVQMNGIDIVGFEEKPVVSSHINAGVYALSRAVLDYLPKGKHCDMPSLFDALQSEGHRTVAYPMHEEWIDVGRPSDLLSANESQSVHPVNQLKKAA